MHLITHNGAESILWPISLSLHFRLEQHANYWLVSPPLTAPPPPFSSYQNIQENNLHLSGCVLELGTLCVCVYAIETLDGVGGGGAEV